MAKGKHRDSLVWGIILIVLGLIFILENFDIEIWRYIWKLWPLILIFWGANKIYGRLKEKSYTSYQPSKAEEKVDET